MRKRERGRDMVQRDRRERERDPEKGDMEVKIKGWEYNKHKEVKGVRIPGYLKKGWEESRWMKVARFRLGSKIRVACYWEEEEEKKRCRLWGERWSPGSTCGL